MIGYTLLRKVQDVATATYECRSCHHVSPHVLRRLVTIIRMFFIPLFPIASWYFLRCSSCGAVNRLTKDEAKQVQAMQAMQRQVPPPQQRFGR